MIIRERGGKNMTSGLSIAGNSLSLNTQSFTPLDFTFL